DGVARAVWRRGRGPREGAGHGGTLRAMIAVPTQDLIRGTDARWSEAADARPQIRHGDDATVLANELLAFLRERFYRSRRVLDVMEQGSERIRRGFERFVAHPGELPPAVRARSEE